MESKNSLSIPLAIIAAGALIALAVYFGGARPQIASNNATKVVEKKAVVAPVSAKDHILGDANADIVVVEYSDLECPWCKVFHPTMHQIVNDYKGQVAWVYRHYPIVSIHSRASKEAEASECAADQGGNEIFWKFIDKVFTTTGSNNTLDPAELPRIARDLGLDVSKFNNCLATGVHTKKITQDIEAAILAGAEGTPYSIIISKDGRQIPINGAEPYANVQGKIDSLLK